MLTAALNLGLPSPINIKVQGTKLEEAHAIAEAIAAVVKDVPGAVDVRVAQPLDYPALRIEVDRVKAGFLGITQDEVIKNIVTALNSSVNFAPAFWISPKNGNHYFMGAQYREEEIESVETLMDIPISMMTKSGVPQTALLTSSAPRPLPSSTTAISPARSTSTPTLRAAPSDPWPRTWKHC